MDFLSNTGPNRRQRRASAAASGRRFCDQIQPMHVARLSRRHWSISRTVSGVSADTLSQENAENGIAEVLHPTKGWRRTSLKRSHASFITEKLRDGSLLWSLRVLLAVSGQLRSLA
jgi:hypothetical protein